MLYLRCCRLRIAVSSISSIPAGEAGTWQYEPSVLTHLNRLTQASCDPRCRLMAQDDGASCEQTIESGTGVFFNTENYCEVRGCWLWRRLTAQDDGASCELTIESTIVYLSSVNKFVRSCIERGADSGLARNFAQYMELLGKEAAVTDLTKVRRVTSNPALQVCSWAFKWCFIVLSGWMRGG